MSKTGIIVLVFAAAAVALFYLFGKQTPGYTTTSALIPSGFPTTAYPLGTASSPAVGTQIVMNPSPVSATQRYPTASGLPSLLSSTFSNASRVATATTPYQQPPAVGSASYSYLTTPTAYANVLQNSNTAFTQATLDPSYTIAGGDTLIQPIDPTIGSLDLSAPAGIPSISDASVNFCDTCA